MHMHAVINVHACEEQCVMVRVDCYENYKTSLQPVQNCIARVVMVCFLRPHPLHWRGHES